MTTVTNTTGTTTATTETGAVSKLNADFDMFLKLLTAQMQNQDPLDPMDTSQYTQQLVQYSQVEQAIEQSGTLKSILASMGAQSLAQATSLIGQQATFESDASGLSASSPAHWGWSAAREPDAVLATITDASGRIVETRKLVPGTSGDFTWDGTITGGGTAPAGTYHLKVTALDTAGNQIAVTTTSSGKVQEVRAENGVIQMRMNGVPFDLGTLVGVVGGGA